MKRRSFSTEVAVRIPVRPRGVSAVGAINESVVYEALWFLQGPYIACCTQLNKRSRGTREPGFYSPDVRAGAGSCSGSGAPHAPMDAEENERARK